MSIDDVDRPRGFPQAELFVDAFARAGDEVGDIALGQLETYPNSIIGWPAVIVGEFGQQAGEADGQAEKRDVLQRVGRAAQALAQDDEKTLEQRIMPIQER